MTHLTQTQLLAACAALDEARRTFDCPVPRVNATEATSFGEGDSAVSYGTHGAAFIQVDPETLEIRCGACAGDLDATAATKTPVERKDRQGKPVTRYITSAATP